MDYEDDSAASALETDDGEDSFFVPADAVAGHKCAAGDILKFEVLGKDPEGEIEVKFSGYEEASEGDFIGDMKRSMAPKPTG